MLTHDFSFFLWYNQAQCPLYLGKATTADEEGSNRRLFIFNWNDMELGHHPVCREPFGVVVVHSPRAFFYNRHRRGHDAAHGRRLCNFCGRAGYFGCPVFYEGLVDWLAKIHTEVPTP